MTRLGPHDWLRLTKEKILHWLMQLNGHATKDPGMRGILKRASIVCHPESEAQKKIALDTEQGSTPRPSVSHGGSSASGAQTSITTSTGLNTGTSDVTREVRIRTHPGRDSNKQQGSHWWRCRDEGRRCRREVCRTPELGGVRQQKEVHNGEGTT